MRDPQVRHVRLTGRTLTRPQELLDIYQLGDFNYQFFGWDHALQKRSKILPVKICSGPFTRDTIARRVSKSNPVVVQLTSEDHRRLVFDKAAR